MSRDLFTKLGAGGVVLPRDASNAIALRHDASGRIYMPSSSAERLPWKGVPAYLESLNAYAGFTNWRLPTLKELLEVSDYEHCDPAVNPELFAAVLPEFHWSSSVCVSDRDYQWGVYFHFGYTHIGHRDYGTGFVLAVCDGLPASPGQ